MSKTFDLHVCIVCEGTYKYIFNIVLNFKRVKGENTTKSNIAISLSVILN